MKMKKEIKEELERIHSLTYGEKLLVEDDFLSNILKALGLKKDNKLKVDEPTKADNLSGDIEEFYDTLEDSVLSGGIKQQSSNGYKFQKSVEALQIGLEILGYGLPIYGVDGKYGAETADAVERFKKDNGTEEVLKQITESILQELDVVKLNTTSYDYVDYDKDATQFDSVSKILLDDLEKVGKKTGIRITITTARTGHDKMTISGTLSRHTTRTAVDIGILDGIGSGGATNSTNGNRRFKDLGNMVKDELVSMGYVWNQEIGNKKAVLWQTDIGGNHYNHLHVSNDEGIDSEDEIDSLETDIQGSFVDVMTLKKMITLLKEKNIDSEDIKKYVDKVDEKKVMEYFGTSDDDFYKSILGCIGAPVTEENMLFMYAWRQSEGGKYKNNPFNTTKKYPNATGDRVKNYQTPKDGVNATCETLKLGYYTCIVDGLKNNIGALNISQNCNSALSTWGTHEKTPLITQVLKGYEKGDKIKPSKIYT